MLIVGPAPGALMWQARVNEGSPSGLEQGPNPTRLGPNDGRQNGRPVIRLAASAAVNLMANALAILVAAVLLPDMALGIGGFVIAVVLFTVVAVVVEPLVRQIAIKNAPAILGSSALIATLISLILTSWISSRLLDGDDGLRIRGLLTWVLATVIVWLIALIGRLTLPLVIFKKILRQRSDRNA